MLALQPLLLMAAIHVQLVARLWWHETSAAKQQQQHQELAIRCAGTDRHILT